MVTGMWKDWPNTWSNISNMLENIFLLNTGADMPLGHLAGIRLEYKCVLERLITEQGNLCFVSASHADHSSCWGQSAEDNINISPYHTLIQTCISTSILHSSTYTEKGKNCWRVGCHLWPASSGWFCSQWVSFKDNWFHPQIGHVWVWKKAMNIV